MAVVIQEGDEKIAVDLKEDSNLQAKSHGYLMDGKESSAGRASATPNGGDITCHREFHDNITSRPWPAVVPNCLSPARDLSTLPPPPAK